MADQPDRLSAPLSASSHDTIDLAINSFLSRLKRPCHILVAYSGGGDSTGLLVALSERLQREASGSVTLVAATIDHGLRAGSAEEAEGAGNLCRALGVAHHVLTWGGEKPKTAIQAEAREARYRLLADCARSVGAAVIVTAHTRDDTEETASMQRARNPEADGGMSEAVLVDRSVWVLRPFLDLRRQAIRRYLEDR
jgi:tRNA(Ile)-lysidine synthase